MRRCFIPMALVVVSFSSAGAISAEDPSIDTIRKQIEAASAQTEDYSVIGTIEFTESKDGTFIVRRNDDAFLRVRPSDVVDGSVSALTKEELLLFDSTFESGGEELKPVAAKKVGEWFRVKLKKGAQCQLCYKSVKVDFTLNEEQAPFYIDTEKEKVVYLERKKREGEALADCSNPSERCNQAVVIFYCYCCCRSKHPECYGSVGCGDGWSQDRCCPN